MQEYRAPTGQLDTPHQNQYEWYIFDKVLVNADTFLQFMIGRLAEMDRNAGLAPIQAGPGAQHDGESREQRRV